jgi:hypothetical protein
LHFHSKTKAAAKFTLVPSRGSRESKPTLEQTAKDVRKTGSGGGSMLKRTVSVLVVCALMSISAAAQARQFLQAPQYPTGANSDPQALAVGDFNNDGIPDMAVANSGTNNVTIFLGNGDGTFTAQKTSPTVGTSPEGIAVGDFNQDGNLDLAVTNFNSNSITILFGNGDGTFTAQAVSPATGTQPHGIAVADFNGDGYPDIVVTNSGTSPANIGVLLNNGSGGFGAQKTYNSGNSPWAVAVGDVNGDGFPDIVVANNFNLNLVSIYLNNGTGGFGTQLQASTGVGKGSPVSIAVGNFTGLPGASNLDIAVAVQGGTGGQDAVSILIGKGAGSFATPVIYPTAPFPTAVAVADLNGDGNLDLAVSAAQGNVVSVFWGDGAGGFSGPVNCGTGDIPYALAIADLNNEKQNGLPVNDLVVANSQGNSVSVIMNNGNESFQSRLDYVAGPSPYAVASADFNGDGIPDLALADSTGASQISILLGNGDGTFKPPSFFSTGTDTDPVAIMVGDFNQDGIPDLAVANYSTSTVSIFIGVGNGTFQPHVDYAVGNLGVNHPEAEPTSIAIADFNGDGYPDLAITNFNEGSVSVLLNNGKSSPGTFATTVNYGSSFGVGNGPISLAAAKLNGDQSFDLVVINETSNSATILQGNGQGAFSEETVINNIGGGNPLFVVINDFNGDGVPDLAVADLTSQQVSILLGAGSWQGTGFSAPSFYAVGAYPSALVAQDFNGDGKLDLAVTSTPISGSPGDEVSLLSGNGDGTFQAPAFFGAGYYSYSLVSADFNGDGAYDLAVANGKSNTVSILLNLTGTDMTLKSSPSALTYGESTTLTATVAASVSNGAAPTGKVTFMNGSTVLGAPGLQSGQASVTVGNLAVGTNALSAVYSGDSNYQPHTVTLSQVVTAANSTTTLNSSGSPSIPGQSVAFTATVTSGVGQPTGTVTFLDGSTVLGTGSISGTQATFSTSSLAVGTHSLTAKYAGNSDFASSTSSILPQVIGQASTTVALSSNPSAANLNQSVTFTATVSGVGGVPTGTVTFFSGTAQLGTGTLNAGGVATYSTSSLAAGTDNITASYSGSNDFLPSTSSAMGLVVTAPGFSLAANGLSPGSIAPGASATSVVTISPVGGLNPSTVNLTCAVTPAVSPAASCSLGTVAVAGGKGTATVTFAAAGPQAALAVPAGDRGPNVLFAVGLVIPAMLLGGVGLTKPGRKKLMNLCLFLALAGCMAHMACGGGGSKTTTPPPSGNSGTPAGVYSVTISGSASGMQQSIPTPLSVTVQ